MGRIAVRNSGEIGFFSDDDIISLLPAATPDKKMSYIR